MLVGAAEITVGIQDPPFAQDLVLAVLGDLKVGVADFVEAVGNVTTANLHPHVGDALHGVDFAVL